MIFSRKCAYAIRAMTRLAAARRDRFLLLDRVCEGTDLPRHYIAKIFSDLKRRGLLSSAKGPGGGFALAREPDDITLRDIVTAVDGPLAIDDDIPGLISTNGGRRETPRWAEVHRQISRLLNETTLGQITRSAGIQLPAGRDVGVAFERTAVPHSGH
jgi:Rrf2 family protein